MTMTLSRRTFSKTLLSSIAAIASRRAFAAPSGTPPLGLNTWSLRALKHSQAIPAILRVMTETGMRDCQLLFNHAEPDEFDPDFGSLGKPHTAEELDEQKRRSAARTAWRLSVPMTYFEAVRRQFEQHGLAIPVYFAPLGSNAEENDRLFLMAKTLGAHLLITRLAEPQTDLVAAAAARHRMTVGLQVSDLPLLERQLRASPWFRADPDIGDLTKAGVSALDFVRDHLESISSMDLKDALSHGASVPFGTGDVHMQQIIEFIVHARSGIPLYIDCDYPGTGTSIEEIERCARLVRAALRGSKT